MRKGNYSVDYFGLKPPPERGCCAEREMYLGTLELFFEGSFPDAPAVDTGFFCRGVGLR